MEKEGLFTTVVGSFPLENNKDNMIRAFEDQINVGINYPCSPQLKSMIDSFLSPLSRIIPSLKEDNGRFFLKDDFKIPDKLIALQYGEFVVDFLNNHPDLKEEIKGTKACLTGPFTLASEIILKEKLAEGIKPMVFNEPRAVMEAWIIDKLAEIMKKIGKAYNEMGFNIISMDEPILGLLIGRKSYFHSEDYIIETLNKALSGIKRIPSIHVCGSISPKLCEILLQTDVRILDHEFRTNEQNFDVFQKSHFENNDKYLGVGTVQTKFAKGESTEVDDYIEDVNFLKKYIKKAIEKYGRENLVIKPDCGFGPLKDAFGEDLGHKIAMGKLKNMVLALKEFK